VQRLELIQYHALLHEIRLYMENNGDADSEDFTKYDDQPTRHTHIMRSTGKLCQHRTAVSLLSDQLAVVASENTPERVPYDPDSTWSYNVDTKQFEVRTAD